VYNGGVKPYQTNCSECGAAIVRANDRTVHFCDIECKAAWQRRQKPVTRAWLEDKYLNEGLDCTQIGQLVNRDPKSVWNWLTDFGIQTRPRGARTSKSGFIKGHQLGVGRRLTDAQKEKIRQARFNDGRIPALINGVHWMKAYGRKPASWRGGITPERQAFYSSPEWSAAVKAVWLRDDARCQRCGLDHRTVDRDAVRFCIHHIQSFAVKELRAHVENLILLCQSCHRWVHSRANSERQFLSTDNKGERLGASQWRLHRADDALAERVN
jgi:ribosomal protein L24E